MDFWQIITFLAMFLGLLSLLPEVMKALKTHHLRDVSWGMLALLLACSSTWTVYGLLSQKYAVALDSLFNICMELTLMYLKRAYEKGKHPVQNRFTIPSTTANSRVNNRGMASALSKN